MNRTDVRSRRPIGRSMASCLLLIVIMEAVGFLCSAQAQSVLQYHRSANRAGNYVVPNLTPAVAQSTHLDPNFNGHVDGHVYAQPLLMPVNSHEFLLVVTENNVVDALDAGTGKLVWQRSVGQPVPLSMLPCGNISPLGITGTPVIDPSRGAIYFDAMVLTGAGPQHLVFGLSVSNGQLLPGFPVNVSRALAAVGMQFTPTYQNQRGALLIMQNSVYIPYGGNSGDCQSYHGWVVGIGLDQPHPAFAWRTKASRGGIWAPGGIASDGQSLFVATGNTAGATQWGGGEAVIRFGLDLKGPVSSADYFAASNWQTLDASDADLGGTNPVTLNLGTSHLMVQLGKDGNAYLLDRDDLGGLGGALTIKRVSSTQIITAAATYPGPTSTAYVAFQGSGRSCPNTVSNPSLVVLKVQAQPSPAISTAWCGSSNGAGAPIVTTTDGHSNPIVWMLSTGTAGQLHAFRGDNGQPLLTSPTMQGVRRFATIVATPQHLYVPADGRIYAFIF